MVLSRTWEHVFKVMMRTNLKGPFGQRTRSTAPVNHTRVGFAPRREGAGSHLTLT